MVDQDDADAQDPDAGSEHPTTKRATRKKATDKAPTERSAKKAPARKQPGKRAAATAEAPRRQGAGTIAQRAAAQLQQLTGHEVEGITAVRRDDDGWVVEIDLLELRRIPATTDVIATYEVEVDPSGDLMGYRRQHRFVRGNVGDGR